MKKLIVAVAALSLLATPAFADEHRGGYEYHEHHGNGGGWVAPLLGGIILGGIISRHQYEDRYRNAPPQVVVVPQTAVVCEPAHYARDEYGNYVLDQYGRTIIVPQKCWYQ
jgi:hypothetical protein